jgi:tRNA-specific 2-thiouridylase
MFVCEKNVKENTVVLGFTEDLMSDTLIASDVNFIPFDKLQGDLRVTAKARYKQKEEYATISPLPDGKVLVKFDTPQRAITKGQAVVFYDGDIVVGGGTIE